MTTLRKPLFGSLREQKPLPHFSMASLSKPLPPHFHSTMEHYHHQFGLPEYNLSIQPLLTLQQQIQYPSFTIPYPSSTIINLHRHHLYTRLSALYLTLKNRTLGIFYTRLRCPRCGQLPVRDHPYLFTLMNDMNHALPKEALVLWRTLTREMEGVDLLRLRQGHLDSLVGGLREVERLFLESDQGLCGVEAWNGGRVGPPFA